MKKKLLIIGVLILALLGGTFFHLAKNSKSEPTKKTAAESLESYTPDEEKSVDDRFIDESGTLDEEQQTTYKEELLAFIDEYYGKMFNFNEESGDFTEELNGYFGTSEVFQYGNKDVVENMYKEFVGVHMNSTYEGYHVLSITNRDTTLPEVNITGYVQAHFSNDRVEEGDYGCISKLDLVKEDGVWKICVDQVSSVMKVDTITACENSDYPTQNVIAVSGYQVMCWDPASADDFLAVNPVTETESSVEYEEGYEPD